MLISSQFDSLNGDTEKKIYKASLIKGIKICVTKISQI